MLNEAKQLYDLGFAIHWLKPKSKMPVESRWTTGERKTFDELKKQYRSGMNLGVRLGQPSKVKEGFLVVVDCDVKSNSETHRAEMRRKLKELFPDSEIAPHVATGRGNGSGHFYAVTESPVKGRRLAQSKDFAMVLMPSSVKPSRKEQETIPPEKLAEGWRIRPAWEISLMGDGQQVVLPPSIHPDTGRDYWWRRPYRGVTPFVPEGLGAMEQEERTAPDQATPFKAVDVDLISSPLESRTVDLIIDGKGCEDRSAALLTVSNAMLKVGYSDNEILSVLSDREYFLGAVAYEHRKTSSRADAVDWLREYTLKKSKANTLAENVFDSEVEISELSDADAEKQMSELITVKHWAEKLERTDKHKIRTTMFNVKLILLNVIGKEVFVRDEFAGRDYYGCDTPWGGKKGESLKDEDAVNIKDWLSQKWRFEPSVNIVYEVMNVIASSNKYHPVRDYIDGLKWDGVERIDRWLKTYIHAEGKEPYLAAVSRKVLCAMVARVYEPGVKFDHVLVLEGKQGIGKSSVGAILAGDKWFLDSLPNIKDKDAMLGLQGTWIVEISELAVLKKSDSESYKAFFTSRSDKVRAPYGRRWEETKRQCVFIGTTNADDYLKDKTGNRRFWPVVVNGCDFAALARDRGQLFAEAKFVWETLGEKLYLEGQEKLIAESVQESRIAEDDESMMKEELLTFLDDESKKSEPERMNLERVKMADLFDGFGPFRRWPQKGFFHHVAGHVLRDNGFSKIKSHGRMFWRFNFGGASGESGEPLRSKSEKKEPRDQKSNSKNVGRSQKSADPNGKLN